MSSVNNISFKGWEGNERLKWRLNNEKELNKLADASKVDSLKTYLSKDSKYLPGHDLYTTIANKKVNGFFYHGIDCVILDKGTSKELVSKSIYESAEKSIGKLYGKLGYSDIDFNTKSGKEFFSKILKFFKK